MESDRPLLFVIFGISGDLAKRKLLPALYRLVEQRGMPRQYKIVGISRQPDYSIATLVESFKNYAPAMQDTVLQELTDHIELVHNPLAGESDTAALRDQLAGLSAGLGDNTNRIYYLSIPPAAFSPLMTMLGNGGHNAPFANESEPPRILVEKPFGYDLQSATALIESADSVFGEHQIYRIDHYLARETAQNILTFRFKNALFQGLWNSRHISRVTVAAHETIDIEGRAGFYEQTGALRDVIQSHLMQLLALIMMEQPEALDSNGIHASKLAFLQTIHPAAPGQAVRGQYQGYKDDVSNPDSFVETFARLNLTAVSERWQGTDIVLQAGKALHERATFIEITFRPLAENIAPNTLLFRLQPTEGITLELQAKKPGLTSQCQTVNMEFDYTRSFDAASAQPYERVIMDAIRGDQTLFASGKEVIASWQIVDELMHTWQHGSDGLREYARGTNPADIL